MSHSQVHVIYQVKVNSCFCTVQGELFLLWVSTVDFLSYGYLQIYACP